SDSRGIRGLPKCRVSFRPPAPARLASRNHGGAPGGRTRTYELLSAGRVSVPAVLLLPVSPDQLADHEPARSATTRRGMSGASREAARAAGPPPDSAAPGLPDTHARCVRPARPRPAALLRCGDAGLHWPVRRCRPLSGAGPPPTRLTCSGGQSPRIPTPRGP